jgi:hypothetical protein
MCICAIIIFGKLRDIHEINFPETVPRGDISSWNIQFILRLSFPNRKETVTLLRKAESFARS